MRSTKTPPTKRYALLVASNGVSVSTTNLELVGRHGQMRKQEIDTGTLQNFVRARQRALCTVDEENVRAGSTLAK